MFLWLLIFFQIGFQHTSSKCGLRKPNNVSGCSLQVARKVLQLSVLAFCWSDQMTRQFTDAVLCIWPVRADVQKGANCSCRVVASSSSIKLFGTTICDNQFRRRSGLLVLQAQELHVPASRCTLLPSWLRNRFHHAHIFSSRSALTPPFHQVCKVLGCQWNLASSLALSLWPSVGVAANWMSSTCTKMAPSTSPFTLFFT